jgi:bacteriocin-like protein
MSKEDGAGKSAEVARGNELAENELNNVVGGWSGPGDEGPEESITFVYGKLLMK